MTAGVMARSPCCLLRVLGEGRRLGKPLTPEMKSTWAATSWGRLRKDGGPKVRVRVFSESKESRRKKES